VGNGDARGASKMMKSLPAPCIFVKGMRIAPKNSAIRRSNLRRK
jgi:hypothetical protein